jgi:GNAT superfamily N-acetyltransferase
MEVQIAKSDNDINKCWEVIKQLRPHLNKEDFLSVIKEMISEGYILAFIEKGEKAVAAIGFRYLQFLYIGKHYYIDDLSTLENEQGKGYAGVLLDFVFDLAKEKGFKAVTLDSGYQRNKAHRLYLNKGFTLNSHHFVKQIG